MRGRIARFPPRPPETLKSSMGAWRAKRILLQYLPGLRGRTFPPQNGMGNWAGVKVRGDRAGVPRRGARPSLRGTRAVSLHQTILDLWSS